MPMNTLLLHALLLLAVIIVLDECWGFFKNQKPFSTTLFISLECTLLAFPNVITLELAVSTLCPEDVYFDRFGYLYGTVKDSRPLFTMLLIVDSLVKALA